MSQKRRGPGVPRADEVPFGIRALERGVEVEGVWVSRGNTPEPSIRNESRTSTSSIWDFMPTKTTVHDIERQEDKLQEQSTSRSAKHGRELSESSISMMRPTSSHFSRPLSAEDLSTRPSSRNGIPKHDLPKPVRSKHPPPSFAKYSGNPSLHRQSPTVRTFEGIEAVHRASTYLKPDSRHGGSSSESCTQSSGGSSSSSDSGPISSAAPSLLNHTPQTKSRHHSVDFELLDSHRQAQAAETGDLTPRTSRPTNSMDLHGYLSSRFAASGSGELGYFGPKAVTTISSTPASPSRDPSPAKVAALSAAARRTSIPDVTPSAQFVQNASSMPRRGSLQIPLAEMEKSPEVSKPSNMAGPPPDQVVKMASPKPKRTSMSEQTTDGAVRPSFEKERRASQVIRGHGTGFEILKPGSLPAATPAMSPPPEKLYALPPISLQK